MQRTGWVLAWALAQLFFRPLDAHAQAGDAALAEELFQQGKTLMDAGQYSEACPKLAESQRLDPATGTLLNLAVCHEKDGKLASAWTEYSGVVTAARREGRSERVGYAEERIRAIQPQLSRLVIELPKDHGVSGLEVLLDATPVGRPALGVALPVDPGEHSVTARAPGKKSWQTTVSIPTGPSSQSIVIPVLEDAPAEASTDGNGTPQTDDGASDGSTQRYVGLGTAALGVVGVGLGSVFGFLAIDKNDQSNQDGCNGNDCTQAGADLRNQARDFGTVSTIAFAVGGAALAGGLVLYFTAPSSDGEAAPPTAAASQTPRSSARVRSTPGGALLQFTTVF